VQTIRNAALATLVTASLALTPGFAMAKDHGHKHHKHHRDDEVVLCEWRDYDYNHFEPGHGRYDPARYYRWDDHEYNERRLGPHDRIYRGSDDHYYCRRGDGTTGLIVGGIAGGVLGNLIAPEDSKTLGTLLGAGAGALVGHAIDRNNVVCR
jgi:hypothetical protein